MKSILVVGGGPIGLSLAVGLVKKGIPVNVIEKSRGISPFPKASTIHPPTLEILSEWGMLEDAKEKGRVEDRIQIWNRKEKDLIAEFNLNLLEGYTKFPYRLHLDQQFISKFFLDFLLKSSLANIRFESELLDVRQDTDFVNVQIRNSDNEVLEEQYSYLAGADGINSTVREKMGITFTGATNPHYHMLMGLENYEISSEFPDLAGVAMFLDDTEWVDMITNPNMLKVIIPMTHDRSDEIDDQFIRAKMKEIAIVNEGFDIFYKTIYKTHQLVADKFVDGKVFLVGDAAHVNIEFGGMGMNSGIHDAYLLVDKLNNVLNEGGDPAEQFNDYASKRMSINKEFVQRDTVKNTKMTEDIKQHEDELRLLASDPESIKNHLLNTSMIKGFRTMFDEDVNTQR